MLLGVACAVTPRGAGVIRLPLFVTTTGIPATLAAASWLVTHDVSTLRRTIPAAGSGNVELSIGPGGEVHGKVSGALGAGTVSGRVEGMNYSTGITGPK